ncbi:MAG: N-acetyltransferase [Terriglobia bacterium]
MLTIRKAELRDVPTLFQMISHYAAQRIMLPRPLVELYENIWEFTVAEEDDQVVGCGALKFYSAELAELRSLCVAPGVTSRGVGRALSEKILDEAARYGLKTVFALTLATRFFEKLGFREVPRERFPTKVWRDCLQCPKYFQCDEKALVLELADRTSAEEQAAEESAKVSA